MDITFSVYFGTFPLSKPYKLSFGNISSFETFYVIIKSIGPKGRVGVGEITPLPGYNHETVNSVRDTIFEIVELLKSGQPVAHILSSMKSANPFAVSGVAVAFEMFNDQHAMAGKALESPMPLTALCDADSLEEIRERASELRKQGFKTLKMKVGQLSVPEELNRIASAASGIPSDTLIRLDANQCYNFDQALQLCQGLEEVDRIELLEQPFRPEQWRLVEDLVNRTTVPIMLDESIWDAEDVRRASSSGAKYVKFKLCKHLGLNGSLQLIDLAKSFQLGVVYGNGVQTAVGNHYEALIHARAGLHTSSESNGFLKINGQMKAKSLILKNGFLYDSGFNNGDLNIDFMKCVVPETLLSVSDSSIV